MCGIAGIFEPPPSCWRRDGVLERMTASLTHRGPDDCGYFCDSWVGFGFRRLAIVDVASGQQPMANEDATIISMCNGEIYNFKELRQELESRGHRFKTCCDCEVLPHLFEEHGIELVHRLNGQFAFAIYDQRGRTLYLARDHFGIQPLYYAQVGRAVCFASEIKSLLEHPGIEPRINLTGLDQALCFPGLVSPTTMFESIASVRNGEYIAITSEGVRAAEYWDLNYPTLSEEVPVRDESYYIETLRELLFKSVARRLQADVPIGVYLSGGLDSSLVVGVVHALSPDVARHTFSVSFQGKHMCERDHQLLMASAVASDHHDVPFNVCQVSDYFERMVYHAECPSKETYNTACMALSEEAKSHGVSVILTGQGSDELFAGYPGYRLDRFFGPRRGSSGYEVSTEEKLRILLWGDRSIVYDGNYADLQQLKRHLYARELGPDVPRFDCFQSLKINKGRLRGRHAVHKRSYLDFKLRLVDHLLADHGDRMAMANGVEVRHPFLDTDLVNFVTQLPPNLKLKDFEEKYLVKRVAAGFVPRHIIEREKFGWFTAGGAELIRSGAEWVQDMLSYERIKRQGYFNPDTVEVLKEQYSADDFRLNQPLEADLLIFVLSFGVLSEGFRRRRTAETAREHCRDLSVLS